MSASFKSVGIAVAFMALVGCGGGNNSAAPTTPTTPTTPSGPVPPLTLVASVPMSGAAYLACNVAPVLDFSGNLDPATVTSANVTLTAGSSNQAITLTVSDAQMTVTPTQALSPFVTYTLTASTAVKGSKGEVLASPASITFSCDGHWQTAATIDSDATGDAGAAKVGFDANGNAISVWTQTDSTGTQSTVWSASYSPATGWATPVQVQSSTEVSNAASIVVEPNGNALVVWDASPDGVNEYIYASRYTVGSGWSAEVQISGGTVAEGTNDIAGDANGDAETTWVQFDGAVQNVWGAHYTVAGGWSAATMISNGAGTSRVARLAMDSNGNVLAVWPQTDGTQYNVWSSRYDSATGWGTAALIEPLHAGTAGTARIRFDAQGNAIAAWTQSDGTQSNIWANRYVAGTGWGTEVLIEPAEAGDASIPRLAVDPSGDAIVVWNQSNGTRVSIWSNRYSVTAGWGTEEMIQPIAAGDADEPWVEMDPFGNALAVWTQSDGTHTTIWANRYRAGIGWATAAAIDTNSTSDAETPMVAIDKNGAGLAVWDEVDSGRDNIWANRFD